MILKSLKFDLFTPAETLSELLLVGLSCINAQIPMKDHNVATEPKVTGVVAALWRSVSCITYSFTQFPESEDAVSVLLFVC